MPKLFWLDKKQLFTTEFHLLNRVHIVLAFLKSNWISKISIGHSEVLDISTWIGNVHLATCIGHDMPKLSERIGWLDFHISGWSQISLKTNVAGHCGFLVLGNTQKILTEIWHQIWDKNDGENICHWNHFQFPRALSELPANWPGLTSLSGWIGWGC